MAPRTPLHSLPAFQRAHSLGAAAWPEVVIPAERFAAFLEDKVPGGADRGAALEALHGADLYLACGCADGDPAA
ncbi:MAG: hypothetical protein JST92_23625, partial [Deltaproteobacteria bacterium]|nr:hypothetical protein [Deltaproteobacteria bacterium]